MISAFLSKLLTTRQASFTEDGIEIFDLNFNMQPLLSMVKFQNETKDGAKMERLGYFISESIVNHFKKNSSLKTLVLFRPISRSGFLSLNLNPTPLG